jgi:ribonuclease P protein component
VLPARYRMRLSTEFGSTVKHGQRAVEPDLVVHARRCDGGDDPGPRIGLVVGKSVGSAVQRHRVARRLRGVARALLTELDPADRIVIRALPGSRSAISARLEQELRSGLVRTRLLPRSRS